ncbi:MAG: glycosyltransferase family 2 protein [Acidobacteria bacterium]|nr:glycosyltransferase family 2 protein [Acidobacteriota bacterium]
MTLEEATHSLTTLVPVSVGVMAHNEETHVESALRAILEQNQRVVRVDEVIVVVSESTDATEEICAKIAESDLRVKVVVEPTRRGKIFSVINFLSLASHDYCVVVSADVFAAPDCVDRLGAALLSDPRVGMAGPQVRPRESAGRTTVAARLARILWEIHHELALRTPKLGELVMVRKQYLGDVPSVAGCDEVMLEAAVVDHGGRLAYVPDAVVENESPRSLRDLFNVRRRIHVQHLVTKRELGYDASSLSVSHSVQSFFHEVVHHPRRAPGACALVLLEGTARARARLQYWAGDSQVTWKPSGSSRSAS